ncbi:MAG TPA: sigma-70 family RNA polymerase sigma factor [Candidatus Binatia bacterium]|nr:sigma-70 family RNA polymerase sigma factor [Candidatus Binatia bacterium]
MILSDQALALERYLAEPTIEHRNELVGSYHYLCLRGARKFFRDTVERSDLMQVAVIGLIKAAERYRPDVGTPFEAYAWLMVVGELMHYVRDYEMLVRIPRWMRSFDRSYREARAALWQRFAREPSARELADEMGSSVETVDEFRQMRNGMHQTLEDVRGIGKGETVSVDDRLALEIAIMELRDRERVVVAAVFMHGLTQREIGERLGVSQRHVSRILNSAMKKMAVALR